MQAIITREYWFSAAHRLEGHPKCGRLHGHNYKVLVQIIGFVGNEGMVIDYGHLDRIVKPIIDELDHRYLVSDDNTSHDDPYAKIAIELKHAYLLHQPTSTAEYLSKLLHDEILKELPGKLSVAVEVQETPKSNARYT